MGRVPGTRAQSRTYPVLIKLRLIGLVRTGLAESSEHALRTVPMNRAGQPGEVKSFSTL
jgi:hypothetical protein